MHKKFNLHSHENEKCMGGLYFILKNLAECFLNMLAI